MWATGFLPAAASSDIRRYGVIRPLTRSPLPTSPSSPFSALRRYRQVEPGFISRLWVVEHIDVNLAVDVDCVREIAPGFRLGREIFGRAADGASDERQRDREADIASGTHSHKLEVVASGWKCGAER